MVSLTVSWALTTAISSLHGSRVRRFHVVVRVLVEMLAPYKGRVYDPCCGSGGLLIKCQLALRGREPSIARPLRLYGQELTGASFAIALQNASLAIAARIASSRSARRS